MIDVKLTADGDIDIEAGRGDVALTGYTYPTSDKDTATCVAQLARMALSTEKGDMLIHRDLGQELNKLVGLPNKPSTAKLGENLIRVALRNWGITNPVSIESWPPDINTLAFEVRISLGPSGKELSFVLKQGLRAFE